MDYNFSVYRCAPLVSAYIPVYNCMQNISFNISFSRYIFRRYPCRLILFYTIPCRGNRSAVSGTFVAPNAAKSVTISTENLTSSSIDLGFVSSFEQCNGMISDTVASVMQKRQFAELLDYEYPTGMPHHKTAALNWLSALGVHTDPDHLAIVSGTLNGLALTLLALFEPGSRIAVDTYAFVNFTTTVMISERRKKPSPWSSAGAA